MKTGMGVQRHNMKMTVSEQRHNTTMRVGGGRGGYHSTRTGSDSPLACICCRQGQ